MVDTPQPTLTFSRFMPPIPMTRILDSDGQFVSFNGNDMPNQIACRVDGNLKQQTLQPAVFPLFDRQSGHITQTLIGSIHASQFKGVKGSALAARFEGLLNQWFQNRTHLTYEVAPAANGEIVSPLTTFCNNPTVKRLFERTP